MKQNKENEMDRMKRLNDSLDSTSEVYLDNTAQEDNQELINEEYKRLTSLSNGKANADFQESYYPQTGNGYKAQGRTVNSIFDNMYSNPSVTPEPVKQPIQSDEAFDLAIKRTLKSGSPVDDMPFYDEVNLNLMKLGFAPKLALDIKNRILRMLSPDEK